MKPTAVERDGGGGGGAAGTRAPRAMERRRWTGMEAGPDDGCAWRRHRGWSTTNRGGDGGGGIKAKEEAAR
jgi:hypothetical protein